MTFARTAAAIAAMLAMTGNAVAAEKPCLQAAEAQALLTAVLPGTLDAVADRCRPVLPAGSTMAESARAMADRYQPDADAAWPLAREAFGKLSSPAALRLFGDEGARKLLVTGVSSAIANDLKPESCVTVARFIDALEPLPARNMAMLVGALIDIGASQKAGEIDKAPFKICPAATARR